MSAIDFTVRPVDTLYFGPPSSIPAGDVHGGRSLFPPPPMAFQGMVRSRLLAAANPALDLDDWSSAAVKERAGLVGGPDRLPDGWQLAGPFPARLEPVIEPWFPMPRFALRGAGGAPILAHRVQSTHPGYDDLQPDPDGERWVMGAPEVDAIQPMDGWISAHNLRFLLTGEGGWDQRGFGDGLPPFVARERRTGVAIDGAKGSAKDGLLYTLETLRLDRGAGFLGRLEGGLPPRLHGSALTTGLGLAGRGARLVAFGAAEQIHDDWRRLRAGDHLPDQVADGARFWVVAIAPARIAGPCAPFTSPPPGAVELIVRAAFVGREIILGGFSLAGRGGSESRPNRAYAPAGSAWLVELRGGDAAARRAAMEALHDKPSIGVVDEHGFGFGHTLVGLYREA